MAAHPAWERPSAGLFVGPAAWFLSTQVNYALTPWVCAHQVRIIPAQVEGRLGDVPARRDRPQDPAAHGPRS